MLKLSSEATIIYNCYIIVESQVDNALTDKSFFKVNDLVNYHMAKASGLLRVDSDLYPNYLRAIG